MGIVNTKIGTLNDILATRVKMYYPHRVDFTPYDFPYDRLADMTAWCVNNCHGRWHSHTLHALYFQFDNERDAVLFALKWK